MREVEAWLRLVLAPEVGPVLAHRLLGAFGEPRAIFEASREALARVPGVGPSRIEKLMDQGAARDAAAEVALAAEAGVRIVTLADDEYPELLRRLENPPVVLWVKGSLAPEDRLGLAMVGPRTPSNYARLMADSLAPPLAAKGLTLISGLAHGVDAAVHRAALDAGGRTLAVLGQGLGTPVFPQLNDELGRRIVEEGRGALVSIFPMRMGPNPGLFPQRNEIIAGLALGTLVIEAGPASGGLITARHAAALGRTVLACPGDATRRSAQGSNRLLADGAALVQKPEDVLAALANDLKHEMRALGRNDALVAEKAEEDGGTMIVPAAAVKEPLDAALIELLNEEPRAIDALIAPLTGAGFAPAKIQERLLMLELEGRVKQLPGRVYARAGRGNF